MSGQTNERTNAVDGQPKNLMPSPTLSGGWRHKKNWLQRLQDLYMP